MIFDRPGLQEWLASRSVTPGTHVCVIGSKVRGWGAGELWTIEEHSDLVVFRVGWVRVFVSVESLA
jgi:hypothetical protein